MSFIKPKTSKYIERLEGLPDLDKAVALAEAISEFKTEKMESVFADVLTLLGNPPFLIREKDIT